jgi:hypothetical protein
MSVSSGKSNSRPWTCGRLGPFWGLSQQWRADDAWSRGVARLDDGEIDRAGVILAVFPVVLGLCWRGFSRLGCREPNRCWGSGGSSMPRSTIRRCGPVGSAAGGPRLREQLAERLAQIKDERRKQGGANAQRSLDRWPAKSC